jgi:hypothetical protein
MAGFDTFDLSRILGAAEQIKGMRREAKTDALRDNYLQTQIAGAQQQQGFQQQEQTAKLDARTATQHYLANQAIEAAPDPIAAVKQYAPERIQEYEAAHGPGSFGQLSADQVRQLAGFAKQKAAADAGIDVTGGPEVQARLQAAQAQDATNFGQQKQLAGIEHGYRMQERTAQPNPQQVITRPVGDGTVQDYLIDTRTGQRTPNGAPYQSISQTKLRPIPSTVAQGIIENRSQLSKIDSALAEVDQNPEAFGGQNYLPDAVTQRMSGKSYSGGVPTRAKVADIGSLVIHDRSGAAVSASEMPRLAPFIPTATDSAEVVKSKLQNLRANIASLQEETEAFYSPEAGYQAIPKQGGADKGAADPLEGRTATGPNGQKIVRRNGQWVPL